MPFDPRQRPLSAPEARVLATLLEKSRTVPDSYPLTLNSLAAGCNQKTSREPVMQLADDDLLQALTSLRQQSLVVEIGGARVDRWEHRVDKALELVKPQQALLGLLFLRGPQTISELLTRSNRLHQFEDGAEVQHQLERLIGRELACLLPRQSGQREDRYMHQLGEEADLQALLATRQADAPARAAQDDPRIAELEARVAALEERLSRLESGQ